LVIKNSQLGKLKPVFQWKISIDAAGILIQKEQVSIVLPMAFNQSALGV